MVRSFHKIVSSFHKKLGLKTVILFSELLLQNWVDCTPTTTRFLFLSSLYLFSILVPSSKHLPQNHLGLCQLEVKLLLDLGQLKVTRYGWLLTQNKITNIRIEFIFCECTVKENAHSQGQLLHYCTWTWTSTNSHLSCGHNIVYLLN